MTETTDLCICCGKNPVTWPRVCEDCQDKEAQAELAAHWGTEVCEGPDGELLLTTGMECRTCGMIYDGGSFCTYCGDHDPLDEGDSDPTWIASLLWGDEDSVEFLYDEDDEDE